MKIAICSDLHLEFSPITLENTEDAQVLILSGDILIESHLEVFDYNRYISGSMSARSRKGHKFFQDISKKFQHIIYVIGNHEHYYGDFSRTDIELKRKLNYLPNVHVLNRDVFTFDGVAFIGLTLWTDFNNGDQYTLHHIKYMMEDFKCVSNSNHKTRPAIFCPEDALEDHIKCKEYIQDCIKFLSKNHSKFVVVGHHAPSKLSAHPLYINDTVVNGGYNSDLDKFILDRPCIELWTHGHTHEPFDYLIGKTRIVCNPRGYANYEHRASEFELKFLDI